MTFCLQLTSVPDFRYSTPERAIAVIMASGAESCDAPLAQAFDSFDALTVERERQKRRVSEEESAVKHLEQLLTEKRRESAQLGLEAERCSGELAMLDRRAPLLEETSAGSRRSLLMLTQMRDLLRQTLQQERQKTAGMLATVAEQLEAAQARWREYEAVYLTMPSFLKRSELAQLQKEESQLLAQKEALQAEQQAQISDRDFCVQLAESWTRLRLLEGAIAETASRSLAGKTSPDVESMSGGARSTGFGTPHGSPTQCLVSDMEVDSRADDCQAPSDDGPNPSPEVASATPMELSSSGQENETSFTKQQQEQIHFSEQYKPFGSLESQPLTAGQPERTRTAAQCERAVPAADNNVAPPSHQDETFSCRTQQDQPMSSPAKTLAHHSMSISPRPQPVHTAVVGTSASQAPRSSPTSSPGSSAGPLPRSTPVNTGSTGPSASQRASFLIQMPSMRRGGASRARTNLPTTPLPSRPSDAASPSPRADVPTKEIPAGTSQITNRGIMGSDFSAASGNRTMSLTNASGKNFVAGNPSNAPCAGPRTPSPVGNATTPNSAPSEETQQGLSQQKRLESNRTTDSSAHHSEPTLLESSSAKRRQPSLHSSPAIRFQNPQQVVPSSQTSEAPPAQSASVLIGPDGQMGRSYWMPLTDDSPGRHSFVQMLRKSPECMRRQKPMPRGPVPKSASASGAEAVSDGCVPSPFLVPSVPQQKHPVSASTPQAKCVTSSSASAVAKPSSIFDTPARPPLSAASREPATPVRRAPVTPSPRAAAGDTPATPRAPPPASVNIFASPEVDSGQIDAPFSLFEGAMDEKEPAAPAQSAQSSMSLFGAGDAGADGEQAADDFSFNFFGGGGSSDKGASSTTSSGVFSFF